MIINQQPPSSGGGGGGKYVAICDEMRLQEQYPSSSRSYCLELDAGANFWVRVSSSHSVSVKDANGSALSSAELKTESYYKYYRYVMPSSHVHVKVESGSGGGGD